MIYKITREKNFGTRKPRSFRSFYAEGANRAQAIKIFNREVLAGNEKALSVSMTPLPVREDFLHDQFTIQEIEVAS